jgi:hypothetical protein
MDEQTEHIHESVDIFSATPGDIVIYEWGLCIIGTEKWVKLYIIFSSWTMRDTKEAFHRSARQY